MPRRTLESLGRLVRDKRGSKKIRETAKEIGIGAATLMRIENGRTPDVGTFGKVCHWLGLDPGSFLGFESKQVLQPELPPQDTLTEVSTHMRIDQNPQPATVRAVAQMVLLAMQNQSRREDPDL
jgi:transcriptional regulator with XRE-family HTH domain